MRLELNCSAALGILYVAVAAVFMTMAFGSAKKTAACHQAQVAAYAASAVPPSCP